MSSQLKSISLALLFLQIVLPAHVVFADTGPKPTMEFTFQQDLAGDQVTIVSGILYECEQPDCNDAAPLEELGPQRFTCDAESCSAMAYGFSQYHKLEIQFSDGITRRSNIFETAGFNSKYVVTVHAQDLTVEAQPGLDLLPRTNTFLLACICAFVIFAALLIGLLIFFLWRRSKR